MGEAAGPSAKSDSDRLLPLLDSQPVEDVQVVAVNPAVNNPRNQGEELLSPAPGVPPL